MRCRECETLLWAYIDGELPETQRRAVLAHLETCPRCANTLEQLRAFPLQTTRLQVVTPPPDFTLRLMQRIAPLPTPQQLAVQRPPTSIWHGPAGMGLAFSTAAAAIFLGILSTAALSLLNGQPVVGGSVHTANSIANAIGNGLTVALWEHLTWSVIFALAGLLLALTVLWLRVIAPRD